jgi:ABC-type transporter Mla MlaB component
VSAYFPIGRRITANAIPELCDRLVSFIATCQANIIICDLSTLETVDITTINALARLQLTARRHGRRIHLRHASHELTALIKLCGLDQVLRRH